MQLTTEYFYDELNQLIRENDPVANKTITYTYDEGGNILQKNEYEYTTSDTLGSSGFVIFYAYDSEWKDLLTSYGGLSITYDEIGNPLTFDDTTLTWECGRKLSSMTFPNGVTASYKYDANGIRTQKTVGSRTTEYFLEGSTIVAQKTGDDVIWYYFDSDGTRDAIEYKGNVYYYMYNPQGDVIGLFDDELNVVVEYTYDSWGKILSITGPLQYSLGRTNPFRYRGYYYDNESGMYYLNSRYYHPEIGRFINADEVAGVNNDITAYNLFAYCGNNPICRIDISGNAWETVFDVASLCLSVAELVANPSDPFNWIGLAGDVVDLVPFVTGVGEVTRAVKVSTKSLGKADEIIDVGCSSYRKLKKSIGSAGTGKEWHHLVEQSQIKKSGFSSNLIQNKLNIISIDKSTHRKISGFYSSRQKMANGLLVRNWLSEKSYQEQFLFGLGVLYKFLFSK